MTRPNILLIMSDQEQLWTLLPPGLQRPGVERLLAEGTGFVNHHVVTLPCGPSRSTIYAGQHTRHTKVLTNPSPGRSNGMPTTVATIGTMLREQGYYTAYKGKWHVSIIDPPTPFVANTVQSLEPYGFAEYTPDGDPVGLAWDGFRRDPSIAADAANWLLDIGGAKPADRPWFLAVNFVNPHDIMFFDATGRMNDTRGMPVPRLPAPRSPLYEKEWDVELPSSFRDDLSIKPSSQAAWMARTNAMLGEIPLDDERSWRAFRSYYFNCLRDLDQHVATVLEALGASGHDENTVVIYTTDHGEAAGAHGCREKPMSVYREVENVPLIIRHPDGSAGTVTESLSSAVDIAPTVLAMAGVPAERRADRYASLHGFDLSAVVIDPSTKSQRDDVGVLMSMSQGARVNAVPGRSCLRALIAGRWKFARYFAADDHHHATEWAVLHTRNDLELYDTLHDPNEIHNIAAEPVHRELVQDLARRLDALIAAEIGTDDGEELRHPADVDSPPGN